MTNFLTGVHVHIILKGLSGYKARYEILKKVVVERGGTFLEQLPNPPPNRTIVVLTDMSHEKALVELKLKAGDPVLQHLKVLRAEWLSNSQVLQLREIAR
jgi:hypothetical protein